MTTQRSFIVNGGYENFDSALALLGRVLDALAAGNDIRVTVIRPNGGFRAATFTPDEQPEAVDEVCGLFWDKAPVAN